MVTELTRLSRGIADSKDITTLTPERERELIRLVQEHSDSDAFRELCEGYTRGLSGCLRGFYESDGVTLDDAWTEILVGFYENVSAYDLDDDTGKRLAYGVKSLKYRLYSIKDDDPAGVKVPSRTMDRYKALRRDHNGDIIEMFKHATSDQGMAPSTLMFIHELLSSPSIDGLPDMEYPAEGRPGPGDRDHDFIALAFAAIADDQQATDVIWLSFNFDQPDEKKKRTDFDVAELTDLTRKAVQKIRTAALQRMREVLIGGDIDSTVLAA